MKKYFNIYQTILYSVVLTLLVFCSFFVPIELAFEVHFIIPTILSCLIVFLCVLAFYNIQSFEEFSRWNYSGKEKIIGPIVLFLGFLGLSFYFILIFDFQVDRKLQKEGVFAIAEVTQLEKKTKKRIIKRVSPEFFGTFVIVDTLNKSKDSIKIKLTQLECDYLRKHNQVKVKYLRSNPHIIKLIISDQSVKTFLGRKNRSLNLRDIDSVITMSDDVEVLKYLNNLSYEWTMTENADYFMFENVLRGESLYLLFDGRVYYQFPNARRLVFSEKLEFKAKEGSYDLYVSEKHSIKYYFNFVFLPDNLPLIDVLEISRNKKP